jgi:hypothetical protein
MKQDTKYTSNALNPLWALTICKALGLEFMSTVTWGTMLTVGVTIFFVEIALLVFIAFLHSRFG